MLVVAELLLQGLTEVLTPPNLMAITLGVVAGIVLGAFPGLDSTVGAALFIPVTYGMSATQALLLLAALYGGAVYAGQIPAILFRIPGASEAVVTTLDGYAMARKGQAGKALGVGLVTSLLGGLFGVTTLILLAPLLANVALRFGPAEYFALGVLGLTAIAGLSGRSITKAVISALIGLLLATVGIDPITGVARFTFGQSMLLSGVSFIPAVIGLFAVAEVFKQASRPQVVRALDETELRTGRRLRVELPSLGELRRMAGLIARSAVIGAWVGILPGVGATTAAIVGYSQAVRLSREPDKFGTGVPEGLAASETANNAAVGGAMVPLLALGIPGSATTAVMLGAFLMHGLKAGPLFLVQQERLAFTLFVGMGVATLLIFPFALLAVRPFVALLRIPYPMLAAGILAFSAVGARAMGDLYGILMMFCFAVLGYLLERYGFPVAPLVLGLVLGRIVETSLRRALIIAAYDPWMVVSRPITAVLLVLSVLSVAVPAWTRYRTRRAAEK